MSTLDTRAAAPFAIAERRLRHTRILDRGALSLSLVTLVVAVLWAFPLYWAIVDTFLPDTSQTVIEPDWMRRTIDLYGNILFRTQLGRWYLNSLITASGVTALVIFISATCGYAISQVNFRGRRILWLTILASFMIPTQALIVSHFFLIHAFGLINTWLGVILPQLIAPIAVIVYKQFFDQLPRDFREAAMIDGASHAQILFRIFLPMNWGVTASLAIITFIGAWNAFLWPFLAVTHEEMENVAVGINSLGDTLRLGYLAAAVLAGLPMAIVYLVFQRRVTQAIIVSAGIKG